MHRAKQSIHHFLLDSHRRHNIDQARVTQQRALFLLLYDVAIFEWYDIYRHTNNTFAVYGVYTIPDIQLVRNTLDEHAPATATTVLFIKNNIRHDRLINSSSAANERRMRNV